MTKFRLEPVGEPTKDQEQAEIELSRDLLDVVFRVCASHGLPVSGKGLLFIGRILARLAASTLIQAGLGGGQLVVVMNVEVGKTLHGIEEAAIRLRQQNGN